MAISLKATRRPCWQAQQIVLWGRYEYHDNTHPAKMITAAGASIASTHAWQMQAGGPLNGKPQKDWANSCPRSPVTNMGSTTKHVKKNFQAEQKTKPCDTYAMRQARKDCWTNSKDNLPGSASDTIPSDNKTSASIDSNNQYHFWYLNKRMLVVQFSSPGHSNFKSSLKRKNKFGWLLTTRMPITWTVS